MNKKIIFGILILLMAILHRFQDNFPNGFFVLFFNYQVILFGIGIYYIFKKRDLGIMLTVLSIILYIEEFFRDTLAIYGTILVILGAFALIAWGIFEFSQKMKNKPILKSTSKTDKNGNIIIVEEEIQK